MFFGAPFIFKSLFENIHFHSSCPRRSNTIELERAHQLLHSFFLLFFSALFNKARQQLSGSVPAFGIGVERVMERVRPGTNARSVEGL